MQSYLDSHPPPARPSYKDIRSKREEKRFPSAYEDDIETANKMMGMRAKKTDNLFVGLWPLDFHSCFGWRSGREANKTVNEYMWMAKIEMTIVNSYRKQLLKQCPEATFIRNSVASHLDALCKPTVEPVGKERKGTKLLVHKFYYPDKISVAPSSSDPPTVNVQAVKSTRQATANSKALIAEVCTALKKIERSKAAAAAPGSRTMDPAIAEKITELKLVSNFIGYETTNTSGPLSDVLQEHSPSLQNGGDFGDRSTSIDGSPA